MAAEIVQLGSNELVAERPFSHPQQSQIDLAALSDALTALRQLVVTPVVQTASAAMAHVEWCDSAGLHRRFVISPRWSGSAVADATLVGFFGQRRPLVERTAVNAMDEELVAELNEHSDLICYCSCQLADGNYGNLVLFGRPEGKLHWMASQRHAVAVASLSPDFYESIRLHNGCVPGMLLSATQPVLTSTKYYDYCGATLWRGVRQWDPPLHATNLRQR